MTEDRREFLKRMGRGGALCLTASMGGCLSPGRTARNKRATVGRRRPNVVLIVSDDHRWNLMGCNGDPYIKTPNMDRLAREGVNFENAFATSGVCSPSRASILTGKYCRQASSPRIVWHNNTFHDQETPFPALLQVAGYHTAHIGKWHLGKGHEPKPSYDHWASFEWLGAYFDTEVFINGEKKKFTGYADDILSKLAADHIKQQARTEQPFFACVGLKAPHLNFSYPPRHEHVFDGVTIPKPDSYYEDYDKSGKLRMKGNAIRIDDFIGGVKMFDNSWDKYVKSHYRSVMGIDDAIGTILDAIDEAGVADDTIVIYTSDQGYTLGEHGLTEKHYAYEEPMRVPMLVRYPPMTCAGARREEMVLNIDIAPTILSLCGVPIPEDVVGRSVAPIMKAGEKPVSEWRDDFLFDLPSEGAAIPAQLAVRTDRYKLITYPDFPERELYDLEKDPHENKNLIDDPEYRDVLADMEKRLKRLVRETGWKTSPVYPILTCWALGPIPNADLDKVRKSVLAQPFDVDNAAIAFADKTFTWKKIEANEKRHLNVTQVVGAPPEHTTFVAIPVERLTSRDPYSELRVVPYRPYKGYVNGRLCKNISIPNHPASGFNPPLPDKQNLIILELPSNASNFTRLELYTEEDAVRLPGGGEKHGFRL